MARKQRMPGLWQRPDGYWQIDKRIKGFGALRESTGTQDYAEAERPDPLPRCGFTHGDWCMGERGRPGHTHRTDCPERVAPVLRWREGIDCERVGGES